MEINSAERVIKKYGMLSEGDTVAVGVSGGADSMMLLSYLFENREKYGIKVIAANVEHGIRGEASVSDTAFVKDYCKEKGIEFYGISINAPAEAKKAGEGVEEYSRKKRYEFFNTLCADKIATAHNLSDNAETMLFRLARGTSNKGICSIPPVRGNIIRPFIELTGEEIRRLCNEYGVPFVNDETNGDIKYTRNYIRHILMPEFRRLNPAFESAVARYIASAAEDEDFLEKCASKYSAELSVSELKNEHPAVAKRVIYREAKRNGATLDENRLSAVYSLLFKNGREQLKGSLFAVSDGDYLTFKRIEDNKKTQPHFKAETKTVDIEYFNKNSERLKKEFAFFCCCDKISGEITVRQRAEGDEIRLSGRGVTKSLKKLMNELKIPADERDLIPVICDDEGVIGVYKRALSERVEPDSKTERVLLMKISLEDND